jgi:hypothetical protein
MNFGKSAAAVLCIIQISCVSSGPIGSSRDLNLIIPGKTAEGYSIGETIEIGDETSVISASGNVKEILKMESFSSLNFDSILYKKDSAILFIENKTIIAIAGLKSERRITSDAIKLSEGTGNFIQNYGTSGLETFTINNHTIHIYKASGIAVFDDNSDGIINMYMIFRE